MLLVCPMELKAKYILAWLRLPILGCMVMATMLVSGGGPLGADAVEGGLEAKSYTIMLEGYKETVTVNATHEELAEYITSSEAVMLRDFLIGPTYPAQGETEMGAGGSFLFRYQLVVLIPGREIFIKRDDKSVYMIRDFPVRNQQKWEFEPASDGTGLTFKQSTEMLDAWWIKMLEPLAPPRYWKEMSDRMLAEIQAHFDPSEDPRELTKHGFRGEDYETVMQAHEVSTWMPASLEDVHDYLNHPEKPYLQVGKSGDDCLTRPLPLDRALRCTTTIEQGGREIAIDSFGIDHVCGDYGGNSCLKLDMTVKDKVTKKGIIFRSYYQVVLDLVGYLEIKIEPEKGGTRLNLKWNWEMPVAGSPHALDQMLFLAEIPKRAEQTVIEIKEGVESRTGK